MLNKIEKGFASIVLVLTIILILTSGIFYYQRQHTDSNSDENNFNPTQPVTDLTNLEMYTNTKYGYSLSYPAGWFIFIDLKGKEQSKVGLDKEDFIFLTPDEPCLTCGGIPRGLRISAEVISQQVNSLDYVQDKVLEIDPEKTYLRYEPTNLPNVDGYLILGNIGAGCPGPELYTFGKKTILNVQTECIEDIDINQIFSSIRFKD